VTQFSVAAAKLFEMSVQQEGHTLFLLASGTRIWTGMVDKPVAYTHYVLLQNMPQ
jgi:hypothetical protein